ncbi:MAG: diacylglycerol kinase [Acidobacteriota bacterium]
MKNRPFLRRLRFAANGIATAFRGESSFRVQCGAAAFVVLTLLMKRAEPVWWAVLLLCCGAVLAAELLNTALEHALDALHPEIHPGIRAAKDCAAGAVLILCMASASLFAAFLLGG